MSSPPIAEADQASGLLAILNRFALEHGVGPTEPTVLAVGSNVVVHLAPAPIVARVANVTAAGRDRPGDALAREVRLALHLLAAGIPTVAPSSELPAGPHHLDGWWVTFFEYVKLTPVDDDRAEEVGRALVDLVTVAAELPLAPAADGSGERDLPPTRTIRDEAEVLLDRLVPRLAPEDGTVLRRAIDASWVDTSVLEADFTRQAIHGDAHRKNAGIDSSGQLRWFDLDDTVFDFPHVDYSTLLRSWPEAGRAACRHAGLDPDSDLLGDYLTQRNVYVALWIQLFGLERPKVHAERAAKEMAELRQRWGSETG